MSTQRNATVEIFKLIAAYMVVSIHVAFAGTVGVVVETLARFAVPFFFAVTGFYAYGVGPETLQKRSLHILRLLAFAVVVYTLFNLCVFRWNPTAIGVYFRKYLDPAMLVDLVAFNTPISSTHLWYLSALTYVYAVFWLLYRLKVNEKVVFALAFALLVLHLALGEGSAAFGVVHPIPVVRNFALTGIPCFALGMLAKKQEDTLRRLPLWAAVAMALIGAAESVLSHYVWGRNEMYLGSLLMVLAAVVVFVRYDGVAYPRWVHHWTACSTDIYLFHVLVYRALLEIYTFFDIDVTASVALTNAQPFIVCVLSTVLAFGLHFLTTRRRSCGQ